MGDNLEVVWAEFSTASCSFSMIILKMCSMKISTSKVANSAQLLSCWLKFVHEWNDTFFELSFLVEETLKQLSKFQCLYCNKALWLWFFTITKWFWNFLNIKCSTMLSFPSFILFRVIILFALAGFGNGKQILEYQHLLLLRDIGW